MSDSKQDISEELKIRWLRRFKQKVRSHTAYYIIVTLHKTVGQQLQEPLRVENFNQNMKENQTFPG